jgi:hypothetical protein
MAEPGYDPIPVNSKKITAKMAPFTPSFIATRKKCIGAIIISNSNLRDELEQMASAGSIAGRDLKDNGFIGTCILIDYNFILLCAHTIDTLFSLGKQHMTDKKILAVFNNEHTKGSVDTSSPVAETNRPYAIIRGDLDACDGGINDDDGGLLKIEWPSDLEYGKVGYMARLPHPDDIKAADLNKKSVCCIEQFSMVSRSGKFSKRKDCIYSLHAAQGKVYLTDQSIKTIESPTGKASHYCRAAFSGTFGGSGSGIFNLDGELVGNFVAAEAFLPLDKVYSNPKTGPKLKQIYAYRAQREGWKPL